MLVDVLYNLFGVLCELITIFLLFYPSIQLQNEAHWSLTFLTINPQHNFQMQNDPESVWPHYLFIQRLICSPIGISVSGLFLLNSATLFSLLGVILTYVVVLYQFN